MSSQSSRQFRPRVRIFSSVCSFTTERLVGWSYDWPWDFLGLKFILFYCVQKKWEFNINRKQKRGEKGKKKKVPPPSPPPQETLYSGAGRTQYPPGRPPPPVLSRLSIYCVCVCVCTHNSRVRMGRNKRRRRCERNESKRSKRKKKQPTDRKEMRWDSRQTFIEWEILFFFLL